MNAHNKHGVLKEIKMLLFIFSQSFTIFKNMHI